MSIETVIATNRFGLGARPGELSRIGNDYQHWLKDQLQGPSRLPAVFGDLPSTDAILIEVQALRDKRREARRADVDEVAPDVVKEFGATIRRHYIDQASARYINAAATDYPFHERLVHFWSNHFAVSADKQPLPALAGVYENEVIRPGVSGRFADLLIAVEKHPAMIVYLDNQRSVGPNSILGKRANRRQSERQIGLNENLAREILELHTLGVDGGYSQQDVTNFAKVITGWSVGGGERPRFREGEPGKFEFRENIHEPGKQLVLNKSYSQDGIKQGEAVLRDLASNEATAKHIATKLVRHFVADDPPFGLVDHIAQVFLLSDGDLPTVHAALVDAEEPWLKVASKYKSPQDFLISTFRAFDRIPDDGRRIVGALDLMGQAPYRPGSPAGWPDTADYWGGADALYKRIEWSNTVARIAGDRVNPVGLGDEILGPAFSDHTRSAVARAESLTQGMTLLLASPDFQRR